MKVAFVLYLIIFASGGGVSMQQHDITFRNVEDCMSAGESFMSSQTEYTRREYSCVETIVR